VRGEERLKRLRSGYEDIAAFGLSPETFKNHCLGLSSKYPEFINCSFTHGLDEVRIFPETKTLENVIELVLENW